MDDRAELSKKEKEDDGPKSAEDRTKSSHGLETKIKEETDADHHPNAAETSLLTSESEQIFIKEEATEVTTEQDLPRKILLEKKGDSCHVFIKEEAQDESAALSREEDDPLTR
jgi:hypothetical protein